MIFLFKRTFFTCLLALCSVSVCCFCTKEDEKNQLATQSKNIDDFIKQDATRVYSINGDTIITIVHKKETNRIVWNPRTGDTLMRGDTVQFTYTGSIFRMGRGQIFAESSDRNVVGVGHYLPGLDAGLIGMRAGEYAYIMFTSEYGYGNKEFSVIPKMSPLMFEVEVLNIVKKK